MGKRIAVVGSGAVGGYLGGHLARTGNDVTLIDPWPEHVEAIRARGLQLSGMTDEETCTVRLPTMHLTEVQSLSKQRPIDIAFVSQQVLRHRMVDGADPAVSCDRRLRGLGAEFDQRGDDRARGRLGPHGRLHRRQQFRRRPVRAGLRAPHHAARLQRHVDPRRRGARPHHAARARSCATCSRRIDGADVTTNLWGERWSKLCVNGMRNGVSAATGMSGNERDAHPR